MKVSLLRPDHVAHKELIDYPPDGCEYVVSGAKILEGTDRFSLRSRASKRLREFLVRNDLTGYLYYRGREWMYKPVSDCDLIHACNRWCLEKKTPWVCDLEYASAAVNYKPSRLKSGLFRSLVQRRFGSTACKKIMPWSNAARESILNSLDCSGFEDKVEVVYPAAHVPEFVKPGNDVPVLLFIGRSFFWKGGKETLNVCEKLAREYDFRLEMVSDVPEEYRRKFESDVIRTYPANFSRSELYERFYSKADVFVLPSTETFGYAYVEALSFGLPVVALKTTAGVSEIIEDGKTGLLVNPEHLLFAEDHTVMYSMDVLVEKIRRARQRRLEGELEEKIRFLLEDEDFRRNAGRKGRMEVEKGKFSIKERNKKLKRIYGEAAGS